MSNKRMFLVIDDDPDDAITFCETLKELDPHVEFTMLTNGDEALEFLRSNELLPALIVLDLNMPKMSGKQFLAALKSDNRLSPIPVVIYTTSSAQRDIDDTAQLGAAHFITKPNDLKILEMELIYLLQHWGNGTP